MKILLVGGSKSGKSSVGQEICRRLAAGGPMIYWATMESVDEEDDARIARHIKDREGMGFVTLEKGRDVASVSVPADASIMFDSVTALLGNEMFSDEVDEGAGERVAGELLALGKRCANLICVCDEIWRDGGNYEPLTESYMRSLADICIRLAEDFDVVAETCCGITKCWKGSLDEILV